MSEKQDRVYARTAQDIERKYQFGKTFADKLGLANDSRDKTKEVGSSIKDQLEEHSTALTRNETEIKAQAETIGEVTSKLGLTLDSEKAVIEIDQVVTKTGYVFGADGLNISKSGDLINNTLDHTGMYVKANNEDILKANKDGVDAKNLHAKTYLIIGKDDGRSRFEDYGIDRTACFWVGG